MKLEARPQIGITIVVELTEEEARALEAFACYSHDETVKVFYAKLGEAYMKPHERGFRSFLAGCREIMPALLQKATDARHVFNGSKRAADVEKKR
jgi:hypothetical protein